jgi:hypothetical protein
MLKNPRHEAVAQLKAKAYLDPVNALSDYKIVQEVYGYSPKVAGSSAHAIMENSGIPERVQDIVAAHNPPEEISRDIAALRRAKKDHVTSRGKVIEIRDNATRLGAVTLCAKALGMLNDAPAIDARSINVVNISASDAPLIADALAKLERLAAKLSPNDPKST